MNSVKEDLKKLFMFMVICIMLYMSHFFQLMSDAEYDAGSQIQALLEYLHERESDLEALAEQKRLRLEQCVQLRNFEIEARQVSDEIFFISFFFWWRF